LLDSIRKDERFPTASERRQALIERNEPGASDRQRFAEILLEAIRDLGRRLDLEGQQLHGGYQPSESL
jgi:hypothetical protein